MLRHIARRKPGMTWRVLLADILFCLGLSGSVTAFGFSVGFFLNGSVEEKLDLFIQRPMLFLGELS